MKKNKAIVAIVGRPNVGKSRLFNRLVRKRQAISCSVPGTTRDRIFGDVNWLGYSFQIIDTGGFDRPTTDLNKIIYEQIKFAVQVADLILLVVSFKSGVLPLDEDLARSLHKQRKKVICVINKYDFPHSHDEQHDFYRLGFRKLVFVSAEHGFHFNSLMKQIISNISWSNSTSLKPECQFAFAGRENVGKSSLINALLSLNRLAVSKEAGTTTDSVYIPLSYNNHRYYLIDTAGIKKKCLIKDLAFYSYLRTQTALACANIVILVIDGSITINNHDLSIAGQLQKQKKPVLVIINKIDLVDQKSFFWQQQLTALRRLTRFLPFAPVILTSAITKKNLLRIMAEVQNIFTASQIKIKDRVLTEVINQVVFVRPPSAFQGGVLKIYFCQQASGNIPTFVLFVNNNQYLHFSYKRFLEKQIRKHFGLNKIPIELLFKSKSLKCV